MRQLHFWQTLQARFLIALILVGLIPFGIVGTAIISFQSQQLTEQSGQDLSSLAQGLAGELNHHVEDLLRASMAFTDLPDIKSMDPVRQEPVLTKLHERFLDYRQIAVAKMDGRLIASAVPLPRKDVSVSHVESFRKAAYEGKQAWIVAPALSGDGRLLHMHTPVMAEDGRVKGVLGSPVSLESFAAVLGRIELGSAGKAFVLDEDGRVLLHQDVDEIEKRRDYSGLIPVAGSDGRRHHSTVTYNVDGQELIAGCAPISSFGWTLVVERPQAGVLAPVKRSRTLAISGLLVTALASLLAAIFLARNLTHPIQRLAMAARALGAGNPEAPVPDHSSHEDEIGTLIRAFATMREAVMDREAGLRHNEARMRAIIDAIPDALFRVDRRGTLLYVKASPRPAFLSDSALQSSTSIHEIAGHLKPEKEARKLLECFDRAFQDNTMQVIDFCVLIDGKPFDYEARFVSGASDEMLIIFRDITEQKLTEAVLRQAQKMEGLGILAGGIAHDFNNLLTAILGQSSLAQTLVPPSNPAYQHIGHAVTSARSAAELASQLLVYAGKGKFHVELFCLNDLITKNLHLIKTALPGQAELVLDLTSSATNIMADRGQIQQVLMNLVINAAEALYANGGRVEVSSCLCDRDQIKRIENNYVADTMLTARQYVCVRVSDNGRGIDEEALAQIFDPFYSTKDGGHGLGLSATLGIMRTFSGLLQVESEVGSGTTFTVTFPADEGTLTEEEPVLVAPVDEVTGTVLVIDDEPFVLQYAEDVLNELFKSVQVFTASGGQEGIDVYKAHQAEIDLVILDMKMPGMDGAETCGHLKMIDPDVKIVLVSGFSEDEILGRVAEHGVVEFLEKPFELTDFVEMVTSFLSVKT